MGAQVSWRIGGEARAECFVYDHRAPILSATDGSGFSLTVTSDGAGDVVSAGHAVFARRFAEQVAVYARECERWAVHPPANPGREDGPLSAA